MPPSTTEILFMIKARAKSSVKCLFYPAWSDAALRSCVGFLVFLALLPLQAHASMFKGEALDTAADVLTWVVLVVAPVVGIGVFLMVHVLPEKIAEKNHHPQTKAIQVLCLLSLFFGGMLWPLAWLWAYSKPVLYQLAYGTDKVVHGDKEVAQAGQDGADPDELRQLLRRVAELEARLAGTSAADAGKT
jgi:CBS domain containing-hemolysin-like protein